MTFNSQQIETLRNEFAKINTVNPDRLPQFHRMFDQCDNDGLRQLATARINFLSSLAVNACTRRGVTL